MINWFKRRGKEPRSYQSNTDWITALEPPPEDHALQKLRDILIRGLQPALAKYVDRELEHFVEDVAQDALLKILDKLHTFRGDSKFTTWAMKIAVREGLTELRRKRYEDISLDDLKSDDDEQEIRSMHVAENEPAPDESAHLNQLMDTMMEMIDQELTDKQKTAIQAIMVHGLPITVVAEQMGTNRNALYKLVHDARVKLKQRFEVEGIDPDTMLEQM